MQEYRKGTRQTNFEKDMRKKPKPETEQCKNIYEEKTLQQLSEQETEKPFPHLWLSAQANLPKDEKKTAKN